MTDKEITPQQYFKDFPEAPFSDTFRWVDNDGFEHMITVRSWSASSLFQAMGQAKEKIAEIGKAPKTATPTAETPAAGVPEKKGYEQRPVPASELPEGLPEGIVVFKEDFDEVEIIPQPDNKASVSFWRDGLKFPIGAKINKWKNENVTQALLPLGEIDPTKAQKVRVAGTQFYSQGSEYIIAQGAHKGEKSHYKDFRLLVARF